MDKEVWIAVLTFGTASVGAIRWLIHVYWSQAEKIEDLRKIHERKNLQSMQSAIDELKKDLREQRRAMQELSDRMIKAQAAIERATQESQSASTLLSQYIDTAAKKIQALESEIIKLAKGLVMIRGGSSGGSASGPKKN